MRASLSLDSQYELHLSLAYLERDVTDRIQYRDFFNTALRVKDRVPLPAHMIYGNPLAEDVKKGTVITREMVVPPSIEIPEKS
jgi:hypothetical protein